MTLKYLTLGRRKQLMTLISMKIMKRRILTDDVDDNEDLNEDYEPRQESPRQGSPLDEEY